MGHDELQRVMGTAGLGVWGPAGEDNVPQADSGLLARLDGVRTRLSALSAWLGRGRVTRG